MSDAAEEKPEAPEAEEKPEAEEPEAEEPAAAAPEAGKTAPEAAAPGGGIIAKLNKKGVQPHLTCSEGEKQPPHEKNPLATVSDKSEGDDSEPESWESQVSDDQLKGIIKSLAKEEEAHDGPKIHDPRCK